MKIGEWQDLPPQTVSSVLLKKQAEALMKLKAAMEALAEKDTRQIALLRERLAILKHGGGI